MFATLLAMPWALPAAATASDDRARVLDERRERLRAHREQQFRAADVDGSRSLTREEIEAAKLSNSLLRRFDEIDANGDGVLSPEELDTAHARRVAAARGETAD